MPSNGTAGNVRGAIGAAVIAYALIAHSAQADDRSVVVAIPVSAQGLDLSHSAGAHALYERVEYAAYVACTRSNRVGLAPAADSKGCYEKALADAIRSSNAPLLIQAYLAKHSLAEASAHRIGVPAQIAAK
jgi:UrcA family protein